ncbi:MAG: BMP family ABC transporter substrate-binding protein [Synechococcaceae cyanobacterium SM2_3_1]|nr:BMP family ABC transporter substrate-binding protein [Synechococcaceae cyanobacterium SM2_3_1]
MGRYLRRTLNLIFGVSSSALAILLGRELILPAQSQETFKTGLLLVGPMNDGGWSQAHVEGSTYVQERIPGVEFEYVDKVNPADRPNVQAAQVADDMIAQGAELVFFTSDDHKDDALATAQKHPDIGVIHISGDYAWPQGKNYKDQPNLVNIMPQMEYIRMVAGCAASLDTEVGKIGYVGPLINDETRRYVNATYLGARYCWETYRNNDPADLEFKVTWIGFWFNIPGVTLDPTKVADDLINGGYDVLMSGLDTPEVALQSKKAAEAGKPVTFTHYGLQTGCDFAPEICLGVPYYNWGPAYLEVVQQAQQGNLTGGFRWTAVDWQDLNNLDTTSAGFMKGAALGESEADLDRFIQGLGDGSIVLFQGPLSFQDGSVYLEEGEVAGLPEIWYMDQLLQGIDGVSQ